jgi:hypothetical protein
MTGRRRMVWPELLTAEDQSFRDELLADVPNVPTGAAEEPTANAFGAALDSDMASLMGCNEDGQEHPGVARPEAGELVRQRDREEASTVTIGTPCRRERSCRRQMRLVAS